MNDKEFDEKLCNKELSQKEAMLHIYELAFVNDYLSRPQNPVYSSLILSEIIARMSKHLIPYIDSKVVTGVNVVVREN